MQTLNLFNTKAKNFAAFSLATRDRYLDKDENWQNKETVWHRCLAFNQSLIEMTEKLKKEMRVKTTGSLSYCSFDVLLHNQKTIQKQEASIIAVIHPRSPVNERLPVNIYLFANFICP